MTRRKVPEKCRPPLAIGAIMALAVWIYSPSFEVPWYFDDYAAIVNNGRVVDLGAAWRGLFTARGVSYLSFALNYRFAGLDLFWFHLVNLATHVACAVLVFSLLRVVYGRGYWLPLFGALIFVCHPLQTQAVTYVVQRMTSLCAFFFLLSVLLFHRASRVLVERSVPGPAFGGLLFLSLVSGMLAVLSKENAAVLPLILLLWLWFDMGGVKLAAATRWRLALPLFGVLLLPFAQFLLSDTNALEAVRGSVEFFVPSGKGGGEVAVRLGSEVDGLTVRYLITQVTVFWIYVRLVFLPFGQMLDYSYPLLGNIFNLHFTFCFLALAGLLSAACILSKKYKRLCFGVWWVILALSVESSFIPLDPIFEHRLYLPMFGFVIVIIELLKLLPPKAQMSLALALIMVFSGQTFKRNLLWGDPVAMWSDNLQKAPHSYRVRLNLAKAYIDRGDELESIDVLKEVFSDEPSPALKNNQRYYENFVELGKSYFRNGMVDEAVAHFERGAVLYPESAAIHMFLATLYERLGRVAAARDSIFTAYRLDPLDPQVVAQYRLIMAR